MPWYRRITAWDYLYFTISLVIILVGLILFALGGVLSNSIITELGAVLFATGIVSTFVEKVLHKQLEDLIGEKLSDHLGDFKLRDVLKGGGITNVIPSRQYYNARRIDSFVGQARHNLIMTGIAFRTAIQFERIQDTLRTLAERNVKITISLVNPSDANAVSAFARLLDESPDQLTRDINAAIDALSRSKDRLLAPQRENLTLKVHNVVPFASGILIDALDPSKEGIIQVEIKPYKSGRSDSFAIEVRGSNDYVDNKALYKTLRESWLQLIRDCTDVQVDGAN
jgi:hypothetical protein